VCVIGKDTREALFGDAAGIGKRHPHRQDPVHR
jgi:hypothetical protein